MAILRPHACNLRKGRHSRPGLHYFLTTSVAGRRPLFTTHRHAVIVLDAIRWLDQKKQFFVEAAVVMPDHLHLAGQLGASTLTKVMHTLKSYTANLLTKANVQSPIWQKGYHDHALRDDEDHKAKVRYLIENPVRAGLVEQIQDYPFMIRPNWWCGG